MCGRFALYTPASRIAEVFQVIDPPEIQPRYNVAPTQQIPVVTVQDGERRISLMRWGLVPWFLKDKPSNERPPMINARTETAATRPVYRNAFRKRRCLVPADAFYEWKREGKLKTPYLFRTKDRVPFAIAGLWEGWRDDEGMRHDSVTLLTTSPNELTKAVHDRMPVILPRSEWEAWLGHDEDAEAWAKRLGPYPAEQMESVRVSRRVNDARNDDPSLVEPDEPR